MYSGTTGRRKGKTNSSPKMSVKLQSLRNGRYQVHLEAGVEGGAVNRELI